MTVAQSLGRVCKERTIVMRLSPLLLPLIAGALTLVACSSPPQTPGPGAAPSPGEEEYPKTLLEAFKRKQTLQCDPGKEHWRAAGEPKRGGTFVRANTTGVAGSHLDVTAAGSSPAAIPQVYGYLVRSRSCFYEDSAIEPDLAASWQITPDGKTWTFKLRNDARWHNKPPVNGRPFTSADVGWTIDYQKSEGSLRSYWIDVTHEEPDAQTIILKLREPDADFLGKLAENSNVMLPREVKQLPGGFKNAAIGTGPFMLKEFKPDTSSTVERNPDWKQMGTDGKPLPYLDEIKTTIFGDYTSEFAAMRAGQIDLNRLQGFTKTDADQLKASGLKLKAYDDTIAAVWGLYFNLSKKPFNDERVRKAVALAIDPLEIIEGAYKGGALPTGFLSSAILQYAWPPEKALEKFKPDRDAAKRLLAEAGYGPGQLRFTMDAGNIPTEAPAAEVTERQLAAVGIEAKIAPQNGAASTRLQALTQDYEAVWTAWSPASFLPDRWLGTIVLGTGGSKNVVRISDPEVDRLALAQARELDPAKRKVIIDQFQDRLYSIMPFVPIASIGYYRFFSCRVQNMRSNTPNFNMAGVEHAWLDQGRC